MRPLFSPPMSGLQGRSNLSVLVKHSQTGRHDKKSNDVGVASKALLSIMSIRQTLLRRIASVTRPLRSAHTFDCLLFDRVIKALSTVFGVDREPPRAPPSSPAGSIYSGTCAGEQHVMSPHFIGCLHRFDGSRLSMLLRENIQIRTRHVPRTAGPLDPSQYCVQIHTQKPWQGAQTL